MCCARDAVDLPPAFRAKSYLRLCLRIGEQHAQVEVHGRADGNDRAGVRLRRRRCCGEAVQNLGPDDLHLEEEVRAVTNFFCIFY